MSKQKIYTFLKDLSENNSKEWMDANRKRYHEAKQFWLEEISLILSKLAKHDSHFEKLAPKETIMRINNNRRFQPSLPIYKDHFACSPNGGVRGPSFYIHISPSGSFVGGGIYRPDTEALKKIRAAVDYNGDELKKIINEKAFVNFYGGISEDPTQLKTSPRGYQEDHPHIDLLRRKSFTGITPITKKQFLATSFSDLMEEAFVVLQPLNAYLKEAIEFED